VKPSHWHNKFDFEWNEKGAQLKITNDLKTEANQNRTKLDDLTCS